MKPTTFRCLASSVIVAGVSLTPVLAAQSTQSPASGAPGGLGFLIMWYVCSRRKANELGGWLLYFYIQLYLGAIFATVMVLISFENYLPSTWIENPSLYPLFLLSALPMPVLLLVQVGVAEMLRRSREYRFVRALRTVLWVDLAAACVGLVIDWAQFQENLPLDVIALIWPMIWLPYFYSSKRVRRVFETKDWIAVLPAGTDVNV